MSETNTNHELPEITAREHGEYGWASGAPANNHAMLLPALSRILGPGDGERLLDLGCGNGSLSAALARRNNFVITGTEISAAGVKLARRTYPDLTIIQHDIDDTLPSALHQRFYIALSAEVVEHLFLPRSLFRRAHAALRPGGRLIITPPYHGWLKNVSLAITNRFVKHWNPAWDHGHIKFFSPRTLKALADEQGFEFEGLMRVGRIPPLAMSMILSSRRMP